MTNKNILKILVIMIAVLSLFAVSCRKSGGGGDPTPQNPNMSIGNLLIISTNGKDTVQGISLRFDYADATVSDVVIDATNDMNDSIKKDNFLIENNTLKLTNVDLDTKKAAVSNFATLTFSLTPNSSTPITKYTETANIYIGKMQTNIGTNDFAKQLSGAGKIDNDKDLFGDKNKEQKIQFDFNPELSKDSNNYLVFTNSKEGSKDNLISKDKFYSNFNELIKTTWQSFGDSYSIETSIEDKTNAIVKLKFEPATFYEPYMFKFIMTNGEFVSTNAK
ncbi:hypothetical protein EPJ79_01395 [Brachyspira aalborgi]|uniref:Lipoprotein n=1 Tax=Brachyspira aalborgi TaxID=29522 RepID=A0A5C8D5Z9_9SPIR|nr:hypothetical protein [Brachyspira aalborgi]TXJ19841.1 hypothetical protein EPJ79_01395 [Brachyspira aalborgi]